MQEHVERTLEDHGVPVSQHTLGVLPPNNQYAEEAVVASVLLDGGQIATVVQAVKPADFYHERTRIVYEAIRAIHERSGGPVNAISVQHELYERGQLQHEAFGPDAFIGYLRHLMATQVVGVHAEHYAVLVRRCAEQRRLIATLLAELDSVQSPGVEPYEVAEEIATRILAAIPRPVEAKTLLTMAEATSELLNRSAEEPNATKLHAGFKPLDDALGGWGFQTGQLVVLAGPPGNGKSTLAWQWATSWAMWSKRVFFQSYEMSAIDLAARAASRALQTETQGLYSARRENSEQTDPVISQLYDWVERADKWPIVIETQALTADQLCAAVRHQQRLGGVDVVIVDHLQQVPNEDGAENRNLELDRITNLLKRLAVSEDVLVIALSQVNRAAENTKGPLTNTAIRDSGAIPANADVVLTIRRSKDRPDDGRDKLQLYVAKNRNGPDNFSVDLELEGWYASVEMWDAEPPTSSASGQHKKEVPKMPHGEVSNDHKTDSDNPLDSGRRRDRPIGVLPQCVWRVDSQARPGAGDSRVPLRDRPPRYVRPGRGCRNTTGDAQRCNRVHGAPTMAERPLRLVATADRADGAGADGNAVDGATL